MDIKRACLHPPPPSPRPRENPWNFMVEVAPPVLQIDPIFDQNANMYVVLLCCKSLYELEI